MPVDVTMVAVW